MAQGRGTDGGGESQGRHSEAEKGSQAYRARKGQEQERVG